MFLREYDRTDEKNCEGITNTRIELRKYLCIAYCLPDSPYTHKYVHVCFSVLAIDEIIGIIGKQNTEYRPFLIFFSFTHR